MGLPYGILRVEPASGENPNLCDDRLQSLRLNSVRGHPAVGGLDPPEGLIQPIQRPSPDLLLQPRWRRLTCWHVQNCTPQLVSSQELSITMDLACLSEKKRIRPLVQGRTTRPHFGSWKRHPLGLLTTRRKRLVSPSPRITPRSACGPIPASSLGSAGVPHMTLPLAVRSRRSSSGGEWWSRRRPFGGCWRWTERDP